MRPSNSHQFHTKSLIAVEITRRKTLSKTLPYKQANGDFVEAVEALTGQPCPAGDFVDKDLVWKAWREASPNLHWSTARIMAMAVPDMSIAQLVSMTNQHNLSDEDMKQLCNNMLLAAHKVNTYVQFTIPLLACGYYNCKNQQLLHNAAIQCCITYIPCP